MSQTGEIDETPEPGAPGEPDSEELAPLLEIRRLRTWFFTADGVVKAVDGVDLEVRRGEVLGLVGESGSGKSVTMLSVLRLVDEPGRIVDGEILFADEDVLAKSMRQMRQLRGGRVAMVFQQPVSSLNPAYRVGAQVAEAYTAHNDMRRKAGRERAVEMLRRVGIPEPERRARAYPHELSGGMAQRVMIAMALAADPELLVADEATTALDVTIQAQILGLMADLKAELGMAMVLITHDLGIVAEQAQRVAVMYAGQVVEQAETGELFAGPRHPYTQGLIASIPVIGTRKKRLAVIPGRVPNLIDLPTGCRFADRCEARVEHDLSRCTEAMPALVEVEPGHQVRCFLHHEVEELPSEVELPHLRRARRRS